MDILLVNQSWFKAELTALGHRVLSYGRDSTLDIQQENFITSWDKVEAALPADFKPELIFFQDNSSPLLITDLDRIQVPSAFYSVDTHHHLHFHRYLAPSFDQFFVAQKDYIPAFQVSGIEPEWLPLWASVHLEPEAVRDLDVVFIGTLDPSLNPERVTFFEKLRQQVEIDVRTAPFLSVYPRSKIILNQTVKGDLNFRVFEAMMSGGLLITERSANGLSQLFRDGEHLVLYEKGNIDQCAALIKHYLQHGDEREKIAKAGREEIMARHTATHRAQSVLSTLQHGSSKRRHNFFGLSRNYAVLALSLRKQSSEAWRMRALLEALRLARLGLESAEELDDIVALDVAHCLLSLAELLDPATRAVLLESFSLAYPHLIVFKMLKIHHLALEGKREAAALIAATLSDLPPEDVIEHSQKIVRELAES